MLCIISISLHLNRPEITDMLAAAFSNTLYRNEKYIVWFCFTTGFADTFHSPLLLSGHIHRLMVIVFQWCKGLAHNFQVTQLLSWLKRTFAFFSFFLAEFKFSSPSDQNVLIIVYNNNNKTSKLSVTASRERRWILRLLHFQFPVGLDDQNG